MQLSVSDLNLYIKCPRAYKLHEIEGVKPQHKSLSSCRSATVRKVVSALHRGEKKPCDCTRQEIEAICERVWQEEIADPAINQEEINAAVIQEKPATRSKTKTPTVTKGDRVLENIKEWCFEYSREGESQVLYSNVSFQTIIADITFTGYIDQVRKVGDNLQVLSFSTGCQPPDAVFLDRDFALSLYAYAIWQGSLFPKHPDLSEKVRLHTIPSLGVCHFPYLERYQKKTGDYKQGDRKGNPLIPVARTKEQLLEFEYEVLSIVSGIEQGFFPMMPRNPMGCSDCQYAHRCTQVQVNDVSFNIEEFEKEEDVA